MNQIKIINPYEKKLAIKEFLDDIYVRYEFNEPAFKTIINTHATYRGVPRCGLIHAPTNYGKSAIIRRYIREYHKEFDSYSEYRDMKPIVYLKLPGQWFEQFLYTFINSAR